MSTDQISDLLTRVRNAQTAGHPSATVPGSKTKERILKVLAEEGYIDRFEVFADSEDKGLIKIYLRYSVEGRPAIKEISRISTPGRRRYVPVSRIPVFREGLGLIVVSTSKGMLSDREARKLGVGGELVCSVF